MFTLALHQKRILRMMAERPCLGIFAEAGTGKTMIALTWIYDGLMAGRIEDALVICPAALIGSWRSAIDKLPMFGYSDFETKIVRDAVTIVSYNSAWVRNKSFRRLKGTHKYEIRPELNHPWGAIFCDESHRLGDPSSVQTTVVLRMSALSDYRYVMTGTPHNMRYTKLYGQLKFIEPRLFGDYRDFKRRYVLGEGYFGNPVKYDVKALESLMHDWGTVARLRECFDMPSSTETDIPVPMTSEMERTYKDMLMKNVPDVEFNTAGVGTQKLYQICSGFYYNSAGDTNVLKCGKPEAMTELIENRDGKTVVFALFTQSIIEICAALTKKGITYLLFDSSVTDPVWRDFQSDPDIKVFVTQYQKGSEGIDLYAADTMIFYEPTPSAYNLEQSKARIMRKGQTKPCMYYYLYAPGSIEERRMRSVRSGVDESRRLADQWAEEERQKYRLNEK